MMRILPIFIGFVLSHGAWAEPAVPAGTEGAPKIVSAAAKPEPGWQASGPETAKALHEKNRPAQVRIGLRMTPFKKVVTRAQNGSAEARYVPMEVLRHTLRARLNKPNHFYVGDWHIETQPLRWIKKTRRYDVRLKVYRRYGAFGQLEENIGWVDVSGVLEEQEGNVHVLRGVGRKRLRDKGGHPVVDVVAGFGATSEATTVSQGPSTPAASPGVGEGEASRGRF